MMLLAVLCAVAGKSWAEEATYSITKGEITGGTVKIYGGDDAPNISAGEISSAEKNTTVYLVTETDYTHSCIGITWRVERSGPSSTAESRTRTAGYSAAIKVDYVEGRVYKYTMPEDGSNVLVSAVFPEKKTEEVTYIDPTKPLAEREQKALAYILDGTETYFGSANEYTWFVCKTPATDNDGAGLTYDKYLTTYGFTRFILADGSKMTVGTAASPAGGFALNCFSGTLDIYGQTDGSGTLSTYGSNTGIHCIGQSLTFNGGTVIANGNNGGIYSGAAPITINGGMIKSVVSTGFGIYSSQGNIIINGGKVWATGEHDGIGSSDGIITLGWSHPDDYIYANGYESGAGNAMIAAGQRFVVCDPELSTDNDAFDPGDTKHNANFYFGDAHSTSATPLSGDINPTDADAEKTIAGKTLRPIAVAETDGQGVTTVSPGFLLSVTASGITPVGRTEPDFTLGTTPYYIYKAGAADVAIPVSVPNYGQEGVDFEVSINSNADETLTDPAVSGSGETLTGALPWTGANDVELRLALSYCTGVKYMDWDAAQKKLVEKTTSIAPDPVTKVYILTGGDATTLPGGWYVVKNWNTDESVNSGSDAFYTYQVKFTCDTHLILADNARMDVGTSQSPSIIGGIYVYPGSLAIYAQSTGPDMGILNTFIHNEKAGIYAINNSADLSIIINGGNITCDVNNGYGIVCSSLYYDATLTINGGNISCLGTEGYGIMISSSGKDASMTINGGHITVSGDDMFNGIDMSSSAKSSFTINDGVVDINVSDNGIELWSYTDNGGNSTIAIYGGKVDVTSANGLQAKTYDYNGHLFLGWKNADDYIHVNNFDIWHDVRTVGDQYLMVCDAVDGIGSTIGGTLDDAGKNIIKGKYLRPAIYNITVPDNVTLTVTDGATTLDPLTVGSGDAAKPYYAYKPTNIVTASLKNESFETDFEFVDPLDNYVFLDLPDGTNTNEKVNANSVTVKMPALDFKFITYGLRIPSDGKKYLAFVDDIENLTADYNDAVILVFLGLEKNPSTGAIEAIFEQADRILYDMTLSNGDKNMVPEGLPVIFAYKTEGHYLPEAINVKEPTSANADAAAETIRQAASPLFMTGTAGQTVADVLRAALTDAGGNPLLDSNNLPLSLDAADYVIFLFDADKFVPVAASASSKLTGRRYLLVVDKVTLLSLLNGSASAARTRNASAPDGLTAASARADNGSARVWTFPLILGNDATGISSMFNVQSSMDTWYTIDGRRLQNRPAHKGVYINNGKKTVIK